MILKHSGVARLVPALFLAATTAARAAAQVVAVQVIEDGSRLPVIGALVSLREPAGRPVTQVLSDESGRALLRAPQAGRFLIRIDRIGYRGTTLGPVTLSLNDTLSTEAVVPSGRVRLPDLTVVSDAPVECQLESHAGQVVAALWEEARKALVGSELTRARPLLLEVSRYERGYGPGGSVVAETTSRQRTQTPAPPFIAADPARLARSGFHARAGDGHVFYAPDARVLLSDEFLSQHCLRPVASPNDTLLVGLGFAPTPKYRKRIDVTGVLWLDRASAELRRIDFEYLNVQQQLRSGHESGRIEFVRLPSGGWIVGRWHARVGYFERGGEVALAGPEGAPPPSRVVGLVFDSLSGRPLAGAVVSTGTGQADTTGPDGVYGIDLPTDGGLVVTVDHPLLRLLDQAATRRSAVVMRAQAVRVDFAVSSMTTLARRSCPHRPLDVSSEGLLIGRIADSTGRPRPSQVEVDWDGTAVLRPGYRLSLTERGAGVVVESDPEGRFRVCGVPAGVEVRVGARGQPRATVRRATARPGEVIVVELSVP